MIPQNMQIAFKRLSIYTQSTRADLINVFELENVVFFMVRYTGEFEVNGEMLPKLYACFINGIDGATPYPSERAAEIDAICRFQELISEQEIRYAIA